MNNYNSLKRFNNHRFFLIILISSAIFFNQCQPKKVSEPVVETVVETPLDRYVNSPDPSYHYEIAYQGKKEGYTFIVLKMISQKWLTEAEVDEPEWWHWIRIVVPDTIEHATGMMLIGGGAKDDELPDEPGQIIKQSALLTNSITAEIHNIPNQPLIFKNDTYGPRFEDELIAYGWRKFLEGGGKEEDAIWLARLPMTKAVVRAMDAVSDLVSKENQHTLDKFVVAGGSKRGWTTWTTAAVDDRVVAIAPIVIDMLNLVPSFNHHWRNYGFWAPAIDDYVNEGVMEWMGTPEFERMLEITEPYKYMERFDIPKLLINATGDQFFQPDSWKFYWDDVIGEKYVRYVPNAGHSLKKSDAIETLVSYYQYILDKKDRPQFDWSVNGSQVNIVTNPQDPPAVIKLWHATSNEEARDFRVDVIGEVWSDSTLTINSSGKYQIDLPIPAKGWKAYFVELTYEQEGMLPLKVTTGVSVFPTEYPFKPFVSNRE
jgi:PhoPQ-activated pathogenicity-related protein